MQRANARVGAGWYVTTMHDAQQRRNLISALKDVIPAVAVRLYINGTGGLATGHSSAVDRAIRDLVKT